MKEHVRLGRVGGIAVGVNWSVFVIFGLVVWALAGGRLPLEHPEVSQVWRVAAALGAGIVFFLSLLAHELSHAFVARRNGVEVEGITLWMFGGVARLEGEANDAGAEFRIAAVGPAVSIVLGAVFLALTSLAAASELSGDAAVVESMLRWLGVINIVLAVFNLMPGAPLDGGRILRAVLWRWRGDRQRAAVLAARAGRIFGFLLVALGFLEFISTSGIGGLWLVFIGFFLVVAATAEEQHAKLNTVLADVHVADVMASDPVTVPADTPVPEFIDNYVMRHHFSGYPVMDGGRVRGLVTLNRIKSVPAARRAELTVGDIACSMDDLPVARSHEPLPDLLPRLSGCADGRAIVLDDDHLVGIVSPTDIARRIEVSEVNAP